MNRTTRLTKMFIAAMVLGATAVALYASSASHALHGSYAVVLLALAAVTSRMKVKLPGFDGNMSVNLPFLVMAVVNLSALEAVVITLVSTAVQCWPKFGARFKPEQMLFNLSVMAFAASVAHLIWNSGGPGTTTWPSEPHLLASATAAFFFGQTLPLAGVIKLAEGGVMRRIWFGIVQLSFPYYVLSAGLTSMTNLVSHRFGWQAALLAFPVMFGIHRSYRQYFGRVAELQPAVSLARAAGAGA